MNTEIDKIRSNFFFSANSEAYQDAFLSWVILNYNSDENPDVKRFSKYFLEKLLNNFSDDTKITIDGDIELERQVHKSDINVIVNTDQGKHLIIIEDKVGSAIHSSNKKNKKDKYKTQLLKYFDQFLNDDKYFDYFTGNRIHLYVYKNQFIDDFEMEQIRLSNKDAVEYLEKFRDKMQSNIDEENKKEFKKKDAEINRDKRVALLQEKKSKVSELVDKKTDFSWIPIDFEKIIDTFNIYYSQSKGSAGSHNIILNSYYQMVRLWDGAHKDLVKNKYRINADNDLFEMLWNDRSWLWEVFFYQLTCEVLGSTENIYNGNNNGCVHIATASSGYYWVWSFHSDNDVYSVNIDAREIKKTILEKEDLSISINMSSPKYGNKDVFELKLDKDNKPTNKSGVKKRIEHASKIQNKIKENYPGKYRNTNLKDGEDLDSNLDNTISKFSFELSEYNVKEIADAMKTVLNFSKTHIDNIPVS